MTRRTAETRREALRLLDPARALVLDVRDVWREETRRGRRTGRAVRVVR